MATREEIREGLAVKLAFYQGRDYWKMTEVDKEYWLTQSYGALEYLHSQGVVIRVDRDSNAMVLVNVEDRDYANEEFLPIKVKNLEAAGYVAVEPLIGEKDN